MAAETRKPGEGAPEVEELRPTSCPNCGAKIVAITEFCRECLAALPANADRGPPGTSGPADPGDGTGLRDPLAVPPGSRCPVHTENPASKACTGCGQLLCEACQTGKDRARDRLLCLDCEEARLIENAPAAIRRLSASLAVCFASVGALLFVSVVMANAIGGGSTESMIVGLLVASPFLLLALVQWISRSVGVAWSGFAAECLLALVAAYLMIRYGAPTGILFPILLVVTFFLCRDLGRQLRVPQQIPIGRDPVAEPPVPPEPRDPDDAGCVRHPKFLAAGTCNLCGKLYCRLCEPALGKAPQVDCQDCLRLASDENAARATVRRGRWKKRAAWGAVGMLLIAGIGLVVARSLEWSMSPLSTRIPSDRFQIPTEPLALVAFDHSCYLYVEPTPHQGIAATVTAGVPLVPLFRLNDDWTFVAFAGWYSPPRGVMTGWTDCTLRTIGDRPVDETTYFGRWKPWMRIAGDERFVEVPNTSPVAYTMRDASKDYLGVALDEPPYFLTEGGHLAGISLSTSDAQRCGLLSQLVGGGLGAADFESGEAGVGGSRSWMGRTRSHTFWRTEEGGCTGTLVDHRAQAAWLQEQLRGDPPDLPEPEEERKARNMRPSYRFSRGQKAARHSIASADGRAYRERASEALRLRLKDHVETCRLNFPEGEELPDSFEVVVPVGERGRPDLVAVQPRVRFLVCLGEEIQKQRLEPPPSRNYWFTTELPVLAPAAGRDHGE